jgi:glutamate N-acetyltransferase/amino-acid N-acetyltransferase
LPVCRNGRAAHDFEKNKVHDTMLQRTVHVRMDLGMGHGSCDFLTCDLTAEYVRINAEYST